MKKLDITHSRFWMGDHADELLLVDTDKLDLFQLSAYRRAVSNFVFILTGRDIPVRFADNKQSFTNNRTVFIGGDLAHGDFDCTVGLACHEATHILFPRYFELVKLLWSSMPNDIYVLGQNKLSKNALVQFAKETYNWVEDRYIDDHAFRTAPGYRGYYQALYDRYFLMPKVTRLLKSKAFRRNDLFSYRFRVINLVNPQSDLDALPALRKVHELLDLPNIKRLARPEDRLLLAYDVVRLVVADLMEREERQQAAQQTHQPTVGGTDTTGEADGDTENDDDGGDDTDTEGTEQKPANTVMGQETTDGTKERLDGSNIPENLNDADDISEKQLEDGLKGFEQQREFLDGALRRSVMDGDLLERLTTLEEAGVELVEVGGTEGVPKVECVVVRKMSWQLITSEDFPFSQHFGSRFATNRTKPMGPSAELLPYEPAELGVSEGITLGQALGRNLQVRGESRTTHHTRLKEGRLDHRLLAEAGYGNGEIFFQLTTSQYKKAHLHLTVDASGSMESKWQRTMRLVVTLAKAVSLVPNLSITVSFRAGVGAGNGKMRAYHVIAYDSRIDRFSKVAQLFPYLKPSGCTPEGLSFEATIKDIPRSDDTLDCYFLNISDGEPFLPLRDDALSAQYSGKVALEHTWRQVERIRQLNVEVLSYFVEESLFLDCQRVAKNAEAFRRMYGKDAQLIDVESVMQIAKTMNERFMRKADTDS